MSEPKSPGAADEDLVLLYQAAPSSPKGRAAVSELLERYARSVYLWCYRRVREHQTALDLTQDVLLSAYQALAGFEGRCRFATWLFSITRNRCFRAMRPVPLLYEAIDPADLPGETEPLDDRIADEEAERRLLKLIDRVLDPRERLALWLRCVERLPVEEITARLDIPGSAGARAVLQTARRKVRAALEKQRMREEKARRLDG